MAGTKPNDTEGVNQYIANLPLEQQIALERVRQIIKNTVPEAVEFISYKMPAYHCHGMIGGFAAFKNHCSFFPHSSLVIPELEQELSNYKTSKGALQFEIDKPLPKTLVRKLIQTRIRLIRQANS